MLRGRSGSVRQEAAEAQIELPDSKEFKHYYYYFQWWEALHLTKCSSATPARKHSRKYKVPSSGASMRNASQVARISFIPPI